MLTNTEYFKRARLGNVQETWLVRLYHGDETNWFGVATKDITIAGEGFYAGVLTRSPPIRSSIDLKECKSKLSNISFQLVNASLLGKRLSEEFLGGSNTYINRKVEVWSCLNGEFDSAKRLKVYEGRLVSVKHDLETVTLATEQELPWERISIPTARSQRGRYFPIVYGDFAYNASGSYCQYAAFWPVEIDAATNEQLWGLMPFATSSSYYRLHLWEEEVDRFVPLIDEADGYFYTSSSDYDTGGEALSVESELIHLFRFKPLRVAESDSGDFTNPENAIDSPLADESSTAASASTLNSGNWDLRLEVSDTILTPWDHSAGDYQIIVEVVAQASSTAHTPGIILLFDGADVGSRTITSTNKTRYTFTINSADADLERLPSEIKLRMTRGGPNSSYCLFGIYDVRLEIQAQVHPTDLTDSKRTKQSVTRLFCGGDGFDKSWSSGACDTLQEIHRDMLIRFAGLTTSTPDGYAALDTARADWSGRLWLHEPTEVRDILDKLQHEGQFIFSWKPGQTPRYIVVESSYSSSDVDATLKAADIAGLSVGHLSLADITTKYEVDYAPHPADDSRYMEHETGSSSARTALAYTGDEGVETVELDWLADKADEWIDARFRVCGNTISQIAFDIVNPAHFALDVGDIIQLDIDLKAGGADWEDVYYMIISTSRSQGVLKIKAQEVYSA